MRELQDGRDVDNRDPAEVGRQAAARGEATMRQLMETQRALDAAVRELRQIADEMKGRPEPKDRWRPCAVHMRMDECNDYFIRQRLGIEP